MNEMDIKAFKYACENWLSSFNLYQLRNYGREVGVERPTDRKKGELIELIIQIHLGELAAVEQSNRGKPVLDDSVDPRIAPEIEKLKSAHLNKSSTVAIKLPKMEVEPFNFEKILAEHRKKPKNHLQLNASSMDEEKASNTDGKKYVGQLQYLNSVAVLLPLDSIDSEEKIFLSETFIAHYSLREGDVVVCYAMKRNNVYLATELLSVNEIPVDELKRENFDEMSVESPAQKINLYELGSFDSVASKCFQWLAPIGKGPRAVICSSPKGGKTHLLQEMARAALHLNEELSVLVLLVEQSPECVAEYRKIVKKGNLVYSTYDDDVDRQVFVAEFILKRAKRLVECGKDVLLFVDSLNGLAHAYNDTEDSIGGKVLPCGLESKTVRYIKKYFGSARRMEKGGSLTIVGAISTQTGNPADEYLAAELSPQASVEIHLDDELVKRRIFPAINLLKINTKENERMQSDDERYADYLLRNEYLQAKGSESLLRVLADSKTCKELISNLKK